MNSIIPLSEPTIGIRDYVEVFKALQSGWLTQNGDHCAKMKRIILEAIKQDKRSHDLDVSVCSNGTTALHLVLLSLEIGPGDEVIVPDFGYIAAVNSVILCGATPVLVDVTEDWTISVDSIRKSITEKTKAVICIDNYGIICDYKRIRDVLNPSIKIIQDAAESFPGTDLSVGFQILGDVVTFSFYANKFITSGEGGAIVGPKHLVYKMDKLKSQNTSSNGSFVHLGLGFNYRITNLQAAIFVSQWKSRKKFHKNRSAIFQEYHKYLSSLDRIIGNNFFANPWLATIRLSVSVEERDLLRKNLQIEGIETRSGFAPASEHDYVMKVARIYSELKNSKEISNQIISLPTFASMKKSDVKMITCALQKNLERIID